MLKYRRCTIIFLMAVFFAAYWYFCDIANVNFIATAGKVKTFLFINETGYMSAMPYLCFFPIAFLASLKFFFYPEKIYILSRERKRTTFYFKRIMHTIIVSFWFSMLYVFVAVVYNYAIFGPAMLTKYHFFLYIFLHFIDTFLYFDILGIVYYIVTDLTGKPGTALFATCILYAFVFIFADMNHRPWIFSDDLVIMVNGMAGKLSTFSIGMIFFRAAVFFVVLGILGQLLFERRSFYTTEK